jgi:hypothetical protein
MIPAFHNETGYGTATKLNCNPDPRPGYRIQFGGN